MTKTFLVLSFGIALASASTVNAQAPLSADSAAVIAVVRGFHGALAKGDSASALALLASDAVILESGGVETRAEYRSHHLSEDIAFTRAVPSEMGSLAAYVNGTTAWTIGTSSTRGDFKGRQINSAGAETMILTKDASGWKIRSIHWSSHARRTP